MAGVGLDFGIGAGANLLGGTIQAIGAKQAQLAMEDAFKEESDLQRGFSNEALGVFSPTTEQRGVETAREQIGEGAADRGDLYSQVNALQFGLQPPGSSRDQSAFKLRGMARAKLGGYSDWALDQAIANIRAQDALNKISSFAGGQARVFPYQMQDAAHSMDDLMAIGKLIQSIGSGSGGWSEMFSGPVGGANFSGGVGAGFGGAAGASIGAAPPPKVGGLGAFGGY